MQISIPIEELRKRKIFLAVPMYGGMNYGIFMRSVNDLTAVCQHYGIGLQHFYLFNESLIQRARNYCADEFLRSDCTHLMFVDSDIGFNSNDVLTMLALASEESEYDVVCGPYPKKCISWEKVIQAVNAGFADENPNVLERFVGDYVFNAAPGVAEIKIAEPVEVLESGTGFMMIKRSVFEKFAQVYKDELSYKPDHVRTEHFDGSREITAFFHCIIDPETKRYLSEDYMFCQYVRKMGNKVWLLPWIQLQHVGTYVFGGSLADLAAVGAAPTADVGLIKRRTNK